MCYIAILMLRKVVGEEVFIGVLKSLGYSVEVREYGGRRVVEGRRGRARLRALLEGARLRVETDDYGVECLKDLDELYRALYEGDLKPEVIQLTSPYIYAYERRRGRTKRMLENLGMEVEEVYSGYCG